MALTSVIGSHWWCCTDTVEIRQKRLNEPKLYSEITQRSLGLARFHSFPISLAKTLKLGELFHQRGLRISWEEWQEFGIKLCREFSIWSSMKVYFLLNVDGIIEIAMICIQSRFMVCYDNCMHYTYVYETCQFLILSCPHMNAEILIVE